jgi:hypothetical protein
MAEYRLFVTQQDPAMPATLQVLADADIDERAAVLAPVDAAREDEYWRRAFWCERYYRPGLDYEDYAPAYCVGYIGYAQYGGDYDHAESSLCANWERIKGDSSLTLADARAAMRAAWDRMVGREEPRTRRLQQRGPDPAASAMGAAPG